MLPHALLGAFANSQSLLAQLIESCPAGLINQRSLAGLPAAGWLFGRAVYLELYWLRERLLGDRDLSQRVAPIFGAGQIPSPALESQLPPREHLLNWAREIQEEDLTRLANPQLLPADHELLREGWVLGHLLDEFGAIYELLLAVRQAQTMAGFDCSHQCSQPLQAANPGAEALAVSQGHYRIGARGEPAQDRELPAQIVELHNYRIARAPVSNAEFLAFMEAGGYRRDECWSAAGREHRNAGNWRHPWHWRQDVSGNWYGLGASGAADLVANEAVSGISRFEAEAFACWAAREIAACDGAVLQHEFQWETAVRTQQLPAVGRVWEWCANPLQPYEGYRVPVEPELQTRDFGTRTGVLRGGSLHTQPQLRRASYRKAGAPQARHLFSGTRLVLPPDQD